MRGAGDLDLESRLDFIRGGGDRSSESSESEPDESSDESESDESEESESESEEEDDESASSIARRCSIINLGAFYKSQ